MAIWSEGPKHPFFSPRGEVEKPGSFGLVFKLKDPGDWVGGHATNSKLPCSSLRHSQCQVCRKGASSPWGAQLSQLTGTPLEGTVPSQAPGWGRVPAPTCLLPFSSTTPTGLRSPRERDGAGTKGSLFTGSWGVGVALARVSLRPLETGRLSAVRPRPEASAVLRDPSAWGQGAAPRATAGYFPAGGVGGEAALGGHCRPLRDGGGVSAAGEVEEAGEGACAGLSLEVRGGLAERSPRGSSQSSGGWNALPLSFHPPPPDPPQHRARSPSAAVSTLPFSFLGAFLLSHPSGQTLMENFTPHWKNAGYERITGAPEHLPRHHRHPFWRNT